MSLRTAAAPKTPQKLQRELEDLQLVLKARNGSSVAREELMRRYHGFVRLKASSYFLAGGDAEDLVQEGMIGLFKAIRDFRHDKETSFRSFAELCVTRQIITAIKSATRFKHAPLNTYVSFSHTPAGQDTEGECTLGDALPGPLDRRSVRPGRLDRGAAGARRLPRHEPLGARVGGAAPLPRRSLVRDDGRRARLRLQDDRQRAPAREAEDPRAPGDARRACLSDPAGAPATGCELTTLVLKEHKRCHYRRSEPTGRRNAKPEKGFEPLAPALQERCSDQLSYSGVFLIVDGTQACGQSASARRRRCGCGSVTSARAASQPATTTTPPSAASRRKWLPVATMITSMAAG